MREDSLPFVIALFNRIRRHYSANTVVIKWESGLK